MADIGRFHALMRDCYASLGLPFEPDEGQTLFSLVFDRTLVVNIGHDDRTARLMLACDLGELPGHAAAQVRDDMLAANFLWHGTHGATLSLNPDNRHVVLCQALPLEGLAISDLEPALETFVDTAEEWRGALLGAAREGTGPRKVEGGDDVVPIFLTGAIRA